MSSSSSDAENNFITWVTSRADDGCFFWICELFKVVWTIAFFAVFGLLLRRRTVGRLPFVLKSTLIGYVVHTILDQSLFITERIVDHDQLS